MPNGGSSRYGRRRVLYAAGSGVAGLALPGCLDGGQVTYEGGAVPAVNGTNRSTQEQLAAASSALTSTTSGVSPLGFLSITDHEFVYESGYLGSTVQGTVTNTGSDRVELVEVRVRVYDADGVHLGQYMARTGDLDGGTAWSFTVIVLENPSRLDRYDIAVLGTPT